MTLTLTAGGVCRSAMITGKMSAGQVPDRPTGVLEHSGTLHLVRETYVDHSALTWCDRLVQATHIDAGAVGWCGGCLSLLHPLERTTPGGAHDDGCGSL